jgi:hypothetical protein
MIPKINERLNKKALRRIRTEISGEGNHGESEFPKNGVRSKI